MRIKIKSLTKNDKLFLYTIIVNVLIPKAGIKLAGIPITLGNILLLLSIMRYLITVFYTNKLKVRMIDIIVFTAMIYWGIRLYIGALLLGTDFFGIIPYFIPLVIYPLTFWVVLENIKSVENIENIINIIDFCLFFVLAYAVFQFFLGIGVIDIPGITVNYSDYAANPDRWWLEKSNAFGNGSKMVSTYQNGNVLGLSILLLFPLAYRNPKRGRNIYFVLFAIVCFLTGSRTVLFGLIIYAMLLIGNKAKEIKLKRKTLIYGIIAILFGLTIFYYFFSNIKSVDLVRRLSSSLNWSVIAEGGGRTKNAIKYLQWFFEELNPLIMLFGSFGMNYEGGAYEMTYLCVFILGGFIGIILFFYPLIKIIMQCRRAFRINNKNWMALGISEGLIVYVFAAFIEGAYWMSPTAINLWLVMAMGYWLVERGRCFSG